ncbi:DoxX family protein [Sinorhizobium psoraleae]|uniref:DoxX family protein n=1 Tax=Sinorhizobium psoraleae TaxID=520838 RepID=A0ABT4KJV3_9HYPH|nr:DoxX family protein [Sinorhizobium psoraleae]MCZ4092255.1 DoxX family protein [Sinorhizobium psoraleae]
MPKFFERHESWGGASWLGRIDGLIAAIAPTSLAQLALRLGLAVPFWRSGISKWDGFLQLNDVAVLLFTSEFQLHLPGGPYPFPAPAVTAFVVACAEVLLSTLLVLGLATRLVALGLLAMTIVIQLTVPDGWPIHLTWAAMALGIITWGAGRLSVDWWIASGARGGKV